MYEACLSADKYERRNTEFMKLSYTWLKDYIDVKLAPEKLADILTNIGLEVKDIEKVDRDHIFEIEVTPNRPDCLSVLGIARELKAATGKMVEFPKTKIDAKFAKMLSKEARTFEISIDDKTLCTRYTGRIITNVNVGPSPKWLSDRLIAMNLRPVNNIVDITNFCLLEMGQPMHAFDFDKLEGRKVVVRSAREGESIITIDGIKRKLSKGMLVIADAQKPVAIAGIMGGLETEITDKTKNILLESAIFNPVSVRRTSFKLALSTDSSYRFERGVDPGAILEASNRATMLIEEMAEGKIGIIKDAGFKAISKRAIPLRLEKLNKVLGSSIPSTHLRKILTNLGFMVMGSYDRLLVEIPSFRGDLRIEEDLIEEVARITGYDNFLSTIPHIIEQPVKMEYSKVVENFAKNTLLSLGIDEAQTYSLVSTSALEKALFNKVDAVQIKNPLSAEQENMRPSLIPGMISAVSFNINRKANPIKLFELGRVYAKDPSIKESTRSKTGYVEPRSLVIAIHGGAGDWKRGASELDFFDLKGIIETLFSGLGIENIVFEKIDMPLYSKNRAAIIKKDNLCLGTIGDVSSRVLANFDIKIENVSISEIFFDDVIKIAKLEKRFQEIQRFPSVFRDISMIAGDKISSSEIINIIREFGKNLVKSVELLDLYKGKNIPQGSVSLTYRVEYLSKEKTLTDEEINPIDKEIRDNLSDKLSVKFR